jgi:hypothetical protein
MKKIYFSPAVEEQAYEVESIMAASGIESEDLGIGFGGTDDGTNDPSSRYLDISWDD